MTNRALKALELTSALSSDYIREKLLWDSLNQPLVPGSTYLILFSEGYAPVNDVSA